MYIKNIENIKDLPDTLLKQITEKILPFVLEDTKLKETDIGKIPQDSKLSNQLTKLLKLRRILAIIPLIVMPQEQYIAKVINIKKAYEKIVLEINPDYKPSSHIQKEYLILDLFESFLLDPIEKMENEKIDSWWNELLSINKSLISISKTNILTITQNKDVLEKENVTKQVLFHIYCNCYRLFKDVNALLENHISDDTILGNSPSLSFAIRELIDNQINFSYLLKNPEDCQRMLDYLRYYKVYINMPNSMLSFTIKKDFLLKYVLSEKTKEQIEAGEKSIYSITKKTKIDRWTSKSQTELFTEGAYNDQNKTDIIPIIKDTHSIIGHGDLLQDNNLKNPTQEKIYSIIILMLATRIYFDITYTFLSLIDMLDCNNELIKIAETIEKYGETLDKYGERLQNLRNTN